MQSAACCPAACQPARDGATSCQNVLTGASTKLIAIVAAHKIINISLLLLLILLLLWHHLMLFVVIPLLLLLLLVGGRHATKLLKFAQVIY